MIRYFLSEPASPAPIVVNGNPRTYKALKDLPVQVLAELQRIKSVTPDSEELLEVIDHINTTLYGFKNN